MFPKFLSQIFVFTALYPTYSLCDPDPLFLSPRAKIALQQPCGARLAHKLSKEARIYCPGSEEFVDSIQRWSTLDAPTFRLTVEVATENDVLEVVKYANKRNLPFLAVNNAHGAIITTGKVKSGIMIWMRKLSSIRIAEDGRSATFGGGILDKAVTDGLWAAGKQTVTGGCECVSMIGPGLGGGHGLLQARHGLISDQFISLKMVLADGTVQTVDRRHELWWAVRGAGHNFGIVTSITARIYDIERPRWALRNFTFAGDRLEALYERINEHLLVNGTQPVDLFHYSVLTKIAAVDAEKPAILFYILQEDTETVDEKFTAPFLALGPVTTFAGSGDYRALPGWIGWGNSAPTCQHSGLANTRFPIELQTYNLTAQRRVYDLLSSSLNKIPAFNRSLVVLEGYSQQGVKAFSGEDSAYPFRGSNLLVAPIIRWVEGSEQLAGTAVKLGEALRNIFHESSGFKQKRTYVNYAFGTESKKEMYGDEAWRQKKLSVLKRKYDPRGRFSFYAPIA